MKEGYDHTKKKFNEALLVSEEEFRHITNLAKEICIAMGNPLLNKSQTVEAIEGIISPFSKKTIATAILIIGEFLAMRISDLEKSQKEVTTDA